MSDLDNFFVPDNIKCIAVTAPAGMPDAEKLARSLSVLRSRVMIKEYLPGTPDKTFSYLAGSAAERVCAFNAAVNDPQVDMILCARGGFGCAHILEAVDYAALQRRNLPVMGYSDITALHCAMLKKNAGIPVAGSNLIGIEDVFKDKTSAAAHLFALDAAASDHIPTVELRQIAGKAQTVTACAYAANLTVLASLCGSRFMPDFKDMILVLEDINEALYKIDRMLTQLVLSGVLQNLKALVIGSFDSDDAPQEKVEQLFLNTASALDIPCYAGFQFGHTAAVYALNARKKLTLKAI